MNIFADLEEKNLSLIEQDQENDQLLEKNKKKFLRKQMQLENEINTLQKSETEVKERTIKTMTEKTTLENQTSQGNNRILSDASYKKIKTDVNKISKLMPGKTAGDQEPLPMLLEIEKHVHKLLKMFDTAKTANETTVASYTNKIRS